MFRTLRDNDRGNRHMYISLNVFVHSSSEHWARYIMWFLTVCKTPLNVRHPNDIENVLYGYGTELSVLFTELPLYTEGPNILLWDRTKCPFY